MLSSRVELAVKWLCSATGLSAWFVVRGAWFACGTCDEFSRVERVEPWFARAVCDRLTALRFHNSVFILHNSVLAFRLRARWVRLALHVSPPSAVLFRDSYFILHNSVLAFRLRTRWVRLAIALSRPPVGSFGATLCAQRLAASAPVAPLLSSAHNETAEAADPCLLLGRRAMTGSHVSDHGRASRECISETRPSGSVSPEPRGCCDEKQSTP